MLRLGYSLLWPTVRLAASFWALAASACNVPVFRYALERWEPDPYEIVVFLSQEPTAEQQALLEKIEKTAQDGLANLTLRKVSLTGEISQPLRMLWSAQENPTSPWMVVRYPPRTGITRSAWAGPLSTEAVGALLESPARREIALKLLRGEAIVWLLLESGHKQRDDEAGKRIEGEIRELEQSLELPVLSSLDPPMNPELPLKIAFSMVRVAPSNSAERMLVNMLLNWNPNLTTATEPMLFPIFGRGRVVPPAIGKEIRAEAIREMAEFLTGPCSCEVKAMNPGFDLLLAADWNSLSSYEEGALPLTGMSQFAAVANNPGAASNRPAIPLAAQGKIPAPIEHKPLVRNLIAVLGIAVAFLAATTLLLKLRASRKPR